MKLIFLVHSLRKGGAERLLLELATAEEIIDAKITVISWLDKIDYDEKEYSQINYIPLIKEGEYNWPKSLFSSAIKLKKILKVEKPDCVFLFSHTVMWLAVLAKIKTKYVNLIMGNSQLSKGRGLKRFIYQPIDIIVSKILDLEIVAPTLQLGQSSSRYFLKPKRHINIIPNGIKISETFNKQAKSKRFTISMLGTLSFHKGQHLAIQGLKIILKKNPNVCLKIIGDGTIKRSLIDQVKEYGIEEENINIMGRRKDAFEILSSSDLFWHLSLSEGMPLAIIEAMACGLPILGFNVNGVNELVVDGKNGYLIEYGDLENLANKTLELISENNLRETMSNRSKNDFNEKYTKKKMVMSYKEFLDNLI